MHITRRDLLAGGASLAALAAASGSALAQAQRPDIVIATNELARGLEPAADTGNVDVRVIYSIFDTLIRRDFVNPQAGGGERLVPGLATSWERVDPRTLDVTLRAGVKFHNGDLMTADDVVFTFAPERLWGPTSAIAEGRSYFGHLEKVEKISDTKVRFMTKAPDLVLESRLATYCSFIINARSWLDLKDAADKANAALTEDKRRPWMEFAVRQMKWKPVGTGPYKFRNWRNNEFIALDAHDDYFGGRPNARSVTFREVPEPATRIAGLVSGEFQMITDVPGDQIALLKRYPDLVVTQAALENSHVLVFNQADPLLADKRIRQALSFAIDRDALNKALWDGQAYVPNGHQLPAFGQMYLKDRPGYRHDPERARTLLKDAGYNGQRISYRIISNYYQRGNEAAQIMLEQWKKVGLNVELEFVENFTQVRGNGLQMHAWSNTFRLPDPSGAVLVNWGPQSQIQTRFKHFTPPAAFNQAAQALIGGATPEARRAAFQQVLDIFEDEMPMTVLYNPINTFAMRKNIGWTPYPIHYMDFRPDVFRVTGA
ncbi:MAG: ABC transporter substrate-binding protein [Beijerinckiaceae bacterium]